MISCCIGWRRAPPNTLAIGQAEFKTLPGGAAARRYRRWHPQRMPVTQLGRARLVLQLRLWCRHGPLLDESGRGGASMSVAVWSGSLVAWERELVALKERIGPVFGRAETRATTGAFLDGLLSGVARKTGNNGDRYCEVVQRDQGACW